MRHLGDLGSPGVYLGYEPCALLNRSSSRGLYLAYPCVADCTSMPAACAAFAPAIIVQCSPLLLSSRQLPRVSACFSSVPIKSQSDGLGRTSTMLA